MATSGKSQGLNVLIASGITAGEREWCCSPRQQSRTGQIELHNEYFKWKSQ